MTRLLRVILLLLPRDFRERHGSGLIVLYRELYWKEGPFRRTRFLVHVLRDALLTGVTVRLDEARQRLRRRGTGEAETVGAAPPGGGRTPGSTPSGGFDGLLMDVRLAVRSLRRTPGFTLAAVLIVALGIGANTTVFCALKAALLAPPPFKDADRLVVVDLKRIHDGNESAEGPWWPTPAFQTLQETRGRLIDPVANYRRQQATLTGQGPAFQIEMEIVAPEYFDVLGLRAHLGRMFLPAEGDLAVPTRVAVLSHAFWVSRFGGQGSPVGRELVLNGTPYEVVGVAPPGFSGLTGQAQLWVPMGGLGDFMSLSNAQRSHNHVWFVVGRLLPGARLEAAQTQMRTIGQRIDAEYPFSAGQDLHYVGGVRPLREVWQNPGARISVLLLAASALLVLLVACADLSGLLIARYQSKARDSGVRLAVGASRWRLVRSWLVECLVLTSLGGVAGLLLAQAGAGMLRAAWPGQFLDSPGQGLRVVDLQELTVDGGVLGYVLATVVVGSILVGLLPALRASRVDPAENLKTSAGGTRRRAKVFGLDAAQFLVMGQVAVALLLVIGAGLMADSVRRLLDKPDGFRAENLLTFEYRLPRGWPGSEAAGFDDEIVDRVAALPGVVGVTRGCIPAQGECSVYAVPGFEGSPRIPEGEWPSLAVSAGDERYFDVLEIPVLQGRGLDRRDADGSRPTAVLNEVAARRFFPGTDPVGRWIRIGSTTVEIVGVAANILHESPDRSPMPEAYISDRVLGLGGGGIMVRTAVKPTSLVPAIRGIMAELGPQVPLTRVATGDELVARTTGDRRLVLSLLAAFSLVTVLLVAIGTWAIVARSVVDRRREIGVRMAFGALGRQVVVPVLRRSTITAVLGLGIGLALAWATTSVLKSLLYGTTPRDPATFVLAGGLLMAVVGLASYLPVRRALKIDPLEVLRSE